MGLREKIVEAFDVRSVSETYEGPVEITDLKDELGTKGHVLVVRGDLAYSDTLAPEEADISTPKLWLYENLIKSPRIQEQLAAHPDHALFDGVGFSSLSALGYHARQIGRKPVVVMARQHVPPQNIVRRYDIETISATGQMEEGYIEAQADVLKHREGIIPMHQALYGARALAPIGNRVVSELEQMGIEPDATFWTIASGANLYGIGDKVKEAFPNCETTVVEPTTNITLDDKIDFANPTAVKAFAKRKLRTKLQREDIFLTSITPLHQEIPNRYLLEAWRSSGDAKIDRVSPIRHDDVMRTQERLARTNTEYDWTSSTALPLYPAIEAAKKGKDVLVMAYGKNMKRQVRDAFFERRSHWLFRWETPAQRVAASIALAGHLAATSYVAHDMIVNDTPFFNGFALVDGDGETWISRLNDLKDKD